MKFLIIFCCVLATTGALICDLPSENTEVRLKKKLFCDTYDKVIRPTNPENKATTLNVRYRVKSFDFEENERTLTVTSWMTMAWKDSRLSWTPSEYEAIETIHANIEILWTPDIYLYNTHISKSSGSCAPQTDCLITSDANVTCVMPCEHVGHCNVGDYTNWPFDRQNCSFTFGSWMKTGEELHYNSEKVKVISTRAKQNNQWKLLSSTSKVNEGKYASVPNETYPSLTFSFLIERHSGFHTSSTIVPCFLLTIFNLTVLWITPGSIERFILCISSLMSHYLYMEFLYWMLPYCGDSLPTLLIFFRNSQIIIGFLVLQTVICKLLTNRTNVTNPHLWIATTVTYARQSRVGEVLLTPMAAKLEDPTQLVERMDGDVWKTFCLIMDRVLFVVILIAYIFMAVTLVPEGYLKAKYDPIDVY